MKIDKSFSFPTRYRGHVNLFLFRISKTIRRDFSPQTALYHRAAQSGSIPIFPGGTVEKCLSAFFQTALYPKIFSGEEKNFGTIEGFASFLNFLSNAALHSPANVAKINTIFSTGNFILGRPTPCALLSLWIGKDTVGILAKNLRRLRGTQHQCIRSDPVHPAGHVRHDYDGGYLQSDIPFTQFQRCAGRWERKWACRFTPCMKISSIPCIGSDPVH